MCLKLYYQSLCAKRFIICPICKVSNLITTFFKVLHILRVHCFLHVPLCFSGPRVNSGCTQSIRLRGALWAPPQNLPTAQWNWLSKMRKLRLKEIQQIAEITESVNNGAVIWTMDYLTSESVLFLLHFTASVDIVTHRFWALSYFSSFIINMQSKQKWMRAKIILRINTVIIKKEKKTVKLWQSKLQSNQEASKPPVFFKGAIFSPPKTLALAGRWHTVGRPKKLIFF